MYAEEDLAQRPEFLEPEMLRADLAGVILRLEALGLGPVESFPFPEPPPLPAINDAYRLLELLGACAANRRLTPAGEVLARLPLEPRLARLLAVAHEQDALTEGLVIAAALSAPDPRESRSAEAGAGTSSAPADSDFLALLELWLQNHGIR